jgi:chemotaxis protein histidine kinase CheA
VAGSTILGNGRVALILDVAQLLNQAYAAQGPRLN